MIRLAYSVLGVLVTFGSLSAQTPEGPLSYTPPTAPPPPDPFGVLIRLFGLTAVTLLICGGVIWWAKRARQTRLLAANTSQRLKSEGQLALDARSVLHVIRVDGQQVVVTTDTSGLRSIVPLQEPFEAVLDEMADQMPLTPDGQGVTNRP
jgi:flagellar biogenesis protein FliO